MPLAPGWLHTRAETFTHNSREPLTLQGKVARRRRWRPLGPTAAALLGPDLYRCSLCPHSPLCLKPAT